MRLQYAFNPRRQAESTKKVAKQQKRGDSLKVTRQSKIDQSRAKKIWAAAGKAASNDSPAKNKSSSKDEGRMARKKPRSAAQKAATKRMLAARKKSLKAKGGGKGSKKKKETASQRAKSYLPGGKRSSGRKKARSAKQKANDKRLGKMAKARAKAARGGAKRGGGTKKRRKKRKNPTMWNISTNPRRRKARRRKARRRAIGRRATGRRNPMWNISTNPRRRKKAKKHARRHATRRRRRKNPEWFTVNRTHGKSMGSDKTKYRSLLAKARKLQKKLEEGRSLGESDKRVLHQLSHASILMHGSGHTTKRKGKRKKKNPYSSRVYASAANPRKRRRKARRKASRRGRRRSRRNTRIFNMASNPRRHKRRKHSARRRATRRRHSRRNPMAVNTKKYLGIDNEQVIALALGGLAVPIVNSLLPKIPGVNQLVGILNSALGPQFAGSAVPILAGIGLNMLSESKFAKGDSKKYLKLASEGMVSAGVIGVAMSASQRYVAPMIAGTMSGINFTPRGQYSGINFTPRLNGGMGVGVIAPYRPSASDFGGYPDKADFGAADFGVKPDYAMDKDVDEFDDDADDDDSSMSGSMG